MEVVVKAIKDFFASPDLLSTSGASAVTTVGGQPIEKGSRAVNNNNNSSAPTHVLEALRAVIGLLRRHIKGFVAVVCIIAIAHVTRSFVIHRNQQRRRNAVLAAAADAGGIKPSSSHVPRKHGGAVVSDHYNGGSSSRQSNAISEVSSIARTPQPHMMAADRGASSSPSLCSQRGNVPEYFPQGLMRDDNGRMYVLHQHGQYVEAWEADEYGQVKDTSTTYGDPDEQCAELLSHFKREASMTLSRSVADSD